MKILELFSGTECLSNAFRARGHQCFTVDWDTRFPSSLHIDIMQLTAERILITYCQYGFTYRWGHRHLDQPPAARVPAAVQERRPLPPAGTPWHL